MLVGHADILLQRHNLRSLPRGFVYTTALHASTTEHNHQRLPYNFELRCDSDNRSAQSAEVDSSSSVNAPCCFSAERVGAMMQFGAKVAEWEVERLRDSFYYSCSLAHAAEHSKQQPVRHSSYSAIA